VVEFLTSALWKAGKWTKNLVEKNYALKIAAPTEKADAHCSWLLLFRTQQKGF
jgi:hypothetical protein